MINSAEPRHVHELFSSQTKAHYVVPPYQREYSWHRAQWEALFADLVESEDEHFLGTIITLSRTKDSLSGPVLEVIDGQQRLTTLTILLAAVHSHLQDAEDLDEDAATARPPHHRTAAPTRSPGLADPTAVRTGYAPRCHWRGSSRRDPARRRDGARDRDGIPAVVSH